MPIFILEIMQTPKCSIGNRKYNVDTVFHCAAYKIVPMVDLNPVSAFENNTEKSNKLFRMCGENKTKIVFLCPVMKLLFLKIYLAIPKNCRNSFGAKFYKISGYKILRTTIWFCFKLIRKCNIFIRGTSSKRRKYNCNA